ncbi:MAG: NAD(P)/FAD-dependent oxidoreductase, partial [Myxococcota bacterium]
MDNTNNTEPRRHDRPKPQYDRVKQKFAEERDLRLGYRPEGTKQFTSELTGSLAKYTVDPFAAERTPRDPLDDSVECLFIGGGFSALLTSARLRQKGVESIRIVERGADVGGTWYWNRYPGVACDVVAYDYLPLLDEMDYVPKNHYAKGDEIYAHCRAIAKTYDLYELAVFETTVTSTVWEPDEQMWHLATDRGDHMKARFVICANGTLSKPKLARIHRMDSFKGHSFHTSRWDYEYTGPDLSGLADQVVSIIGTGASAVQAVPHLGIAAKELYVFQRTPSSVDIKTDWPTDPNWARKLETGWQAKRRARAMVEPELSPEQLAMPSDEKVRRQEQANIRQMMRIHRHIEKIVKDPETAEALKPWYMM